MAMIVQHNITAMNSNRMLGVTTGSQAKSTEKLSSGFKINRAADDAAGLTISEKMRKQIRGLTQASTNAQDGVSSVQTAEGALTEVHSMLQRMNQLATQAANGTNSKGDRDAIQAEIDQLTTEIDRVAETTKFNEIYLLKGEKDGASSTVNVAAHDAGLAGKLVDNGDGTSTFTADEFKVGDKVTIGGKEYTIGKPKTVDEYINLTAAKAADMTTGDSVIKADGTRTTIVDKVTIATAEALSWAEGDTFTAKDGTEYIYKNAGTDTVGSGANTFDNDAGWYTQDEIDSWPTLGADQSSNVAFGDGDTITSYDDDPTYNGMSVVATLAGGEVSSKDATNIAALQNDLKVGDTVVMNGRSQVVTTDDTTATLATLKAALLAAGDGVDLAINDDDEGRTLGVMTDANANTLTATDFLAQIKEGDKVTIDGVDYTAVGIDAAKENTITARDAYAKMAEELKKASSIGVDDGKDAIVTNNGNGTFTINQGTVEVTDALSFNLHVGADADMTNKINVNIDSMDTAGLGIQKLNVSDETGMAATYAIDSIQDAISKVSSQRSALGAVQNRLEHTIANVDNVVENTTAAESRIRDTDMAKEMVEYSKNNILAQAGQAMLAQANQSNQGVLGLLG